MRKKIPIAVARGNGIGPEIMEVTLNILKEVGADVEPHEIEIGEKLYNAGHTTGIEEASWDIIRSCKAFLKAPITTPQGGGFKSLNVTIRSTLGLYANIRPCISYHPFISTLHPNMDVVIVRENEEDVYSGIEYRQTPDTYQALKLNTRPGCEKIIRFAFEYARANGRKKVSCFSKDNILKLSDGLFHKVFDEIAAEYPDIAHDHWIIDIGSANLATTPGMYDVIVTTNLYGDIISDIAAQITGSVGLVGTTNIGENGAMFEAIHGSAPAIAGKNIANPSGLIHACVQMLAYIGRTKEAALIHNGWLKTIEDGIHTPDIATKEHTKEQVGTDGFGEALIKRLGEKPEKLPEQYYEAAMTLPRYEPKKKSVDRELLGIDIFVYAQMDAAAFTKKLLDIEATPFALQMITNRGTRIYPDGYPETYCVDHWRARFMPDDENPPTPLDLIKLQELLIAHKIDIIKTENLYAFEDTPSYSQPKNS